MIDWQPIETAPRDGKRILVIDADGLVDVAQWGIGAWFQPEGIWTGGGGDYGIYSATHWMPLPDPPSAEKVDTQAPAR